MNPPPQPFERPSEAARKAAAAYVWQSSYEQGAHAGWKAGWNAAFDTNTPPFSEQNSSAVQLELNEEWARFFSRPKTKDKTKEDDIPDLSDLSALGGGVSQRERLRKKRELYAHVATRIVEEENVADALFQTEVDRTGAQYWPVLALRNPE